MKGYTRKTKKKVIGEKIFRYKSINIDDGKRNVDTFDQLIRVDDQQTIKSARSDDNLFTCAQKRAILHFTQKKR